jgi:dihydroflavonol-4-reductase
VVLEHVERGLDAVIVNPTSIVGPHDHKPSPQGCALLGMVCRRWLPLVDAGYDWVDVRDVVRGALAALERGRPGERYILGSQRLTFRQIAAHIAEATGLRVPRVTLPLWTGYLGLPFARLWSALTGARQLLTLESLRILTRHRRICCDKARAELGYAPRPFGRTMADTFAWYRDAGLLPERLLRATALSTPPLRKS